MKDPRIYFGERFDEARIIRSGTRGRLKWVMLTVGTHPCCYVGVDKFHKLYGEGYDDIRDGNGEYIYVHGGLTFASNELSANPFKKDLWWFGWDYAHSGDLCDYGIALTGITRMRDDKAWTVEELQIDINEALRLFQKKRWKVKKITYE